MMNNSDSENTTVDHVNSVVCNLHQIKQSKFFGTPSIIEPYVNNMEILCFTNIIYTPLAKLLARQARPGMTQDGSGNKAENYLSISATNQHQLRQKVYQ